jgi:hypothetical protein
VKKNDEFHQVGVGLLPEWLLAPSASYSARKRSRVRARRPRAHCAADCSDSVRPERFRRSRPRGHVFPGSTDFAEVALICSRSFSTGNGQLRNRYRPRAVLTTKLTRFRLSIAHSRSDPLLGLCRFCLHLAHDFCARTLSSLFPLWSGG